MTAAGVELAQLERTALNCCAVPPWIIASADFNTDPLPLELQGVRHFNRRLFAQLDGEPLPERRGQIFHEYLQVKFALHLWNEHRGKARSSLRNSYVRFLQGWGVDSNGIEGAVLKGWVQSRFGIYPTYHRGVLRLKGGEDDARFAYDRMRGSAKTNAIYEQLDLLYEFCQYELQRRWAERATLTLYRGTNDPEEHPVRAREGRRMCVRINNLVSFTADRERAWEFGSTVWQSTIAASKIVFFSGLLPTSLLSGEAEYMVVGGDYWVQELWY
ncbi:MAG: NAD(+)--dinitrogen-reductase ADP-D-ribosyltransferase [Verrucomicrobiota bacterium JB022]|nr:NAD(+)--dinitrogen-reductase ADP-D-ribosyltransferase [Verrucomicrobiota bacterium JB022]